MNSVDVSVQLFCGQGVLRPCHKDFFSFLSILPCAVDPAYWRVVLGTDLDVDVVAQDTVYQLHHLKDLSGLVAAQAMGECVFSCVSASYAGRVVLLPDSVNFTVAALPPDLYCVTTATASSVKKTCLSSPRLKSHFSKHAQG